MTPQLFSFAFFRLPHLAAEFLRKNNIYHLSYGQFESLIMFFMQVKITADNECTVERYTRSLITKRLIFKIASNERKVVCSISSKGVIFVNQFFAFVDAKYRLHNDTFKVDSEEFTKNYFVSKDLRERLIEK